MQRSRRGLVPRTPRGRGPAVTFAARVSAGGTVTALAICLIAALVTGVSILHRIREAGAPRPAHAAPVISRASARPPAPRRAVTGAPVAELTRAVGRLMSLQEGAAARRDYGTAPTGRPVVQLTRTSDDRSWAFGTTVIPVPAGSAAPPWTALFLAHASGGRWSITLSGTAGFAQMLASGSNTVLSAPETQLLARFNAAQSTPVGGNDPPASRASPAAGTSPGGNPAGNAGGGGSSAGSVAAPTGTATPVSSGAPGDAGIPSGAGHVQGGAPVPTATGSQGTTSLALPWQTGQSWRFVAAFSGSGTGLGATMFAFSGGDGRVLAAAAGRLYRFCGGPGSDALIEVIHPDGSATEYYQLRAETRAVDGSFVAAGSYLGMTGTSLACGGMVAGQGPGTGHGVGGGTGKKASHQAPGTVSFAVLADGGVMNLNGLTLGGWTFYERAQPQLVWAQRAADRVTLGALLENYGATAEPAATSVPSPAASATASPGPSGPPPSSPPGKPAPSPPAAGRG